MRRRSPRRPPAGPVGSCPYSRRVPRDKNEPVRLTRIYTRGGDAGQTSLGDGSRTATLDPHVNPLVRVYLNRVSDLLFIFSRAANALAGRDEPLWRPGASPS